MAAVQEVEPAVREHQRPRQRVEPAVQRGGVADLLFERRRVHTRGDFGVLGWGSGGGLHCSSVLLQYSNTFSTLRTPPEVRASSVAMSASVSVTGPSN